MLKMTLNNLQLFAHKKVEVLHQTGRDLLKRLEPKQLTDNCNRWINLPSTVQYLPRCKRWTWRRYLFAKVEGVVMLLNVKDAIKASFCLPIAK